MLSSELSVADISYKMWPILETAKYSEMVDTLAIMRDCIVNSIKQWSTKLGRPILQISNVTYIYTHPSKT
jgi:hypothetical protein